MPLVLLGGIALGSTAASTDVQAAALDVCTAQKECRSPLEAAERAFAQQKYSDALAGYKAAYASVPSPSLLLRIGRCQQLLGNSDEARTTYRTVRSSQTLDDETRQKLSTYTAELDDSAANSALRTDNTLIVTPRREENTRPFYKTWWFWTGTGVALGGVAIALAIGLAPRAQAEITWAP